jgi:hypothetical protein
MKEIVINTQYGGFGLSHKAFLRLRELGQVEAQDEPDWGEHYSDGSGPREQHGWDSFGQDIPRDDPLLIQVIRELGKAANGNCAKLKVVKIPNDVDWVLEEYDGREWISECHRTWP